jgi:hypothetical protein
VENRLLGNNWPWLPNRMWPDYDDDERFLSFGGNFEVVKLARFHSPDITAFLASDPKDFIPTAGQPIFLNCLRRC